MADFDSAVALVIAREIGTAPNGGYTNDPSDPGGETKWGISKTAHPDLDIKNLTLDQAKAIYRAEYWKFDLVLDQGVATKTLDMCVNIGNVPATKTLQVAVGAKVVDGLFGPTTLALVNRSTPATLLNELRAQAAFYHVALTRADSKLAKYLLGWLRRDVL